MINPGLKNGWKGSLGSVVPEKRWNGSEEEPERHRGRSPGLPDSSLPPGKGSLTKRRRRKGLRRRFLSLTEGLANLFSNERNYNDGASYKGSNESLRSLRQSPISRQISLSDDLCSGYASDFSTEFEHQRFRRQGGQLNSFRPTYVNGPKTPVTEGKFRKAKSPSIDLIKKAPPSPPPRRASFFRRDSQKSISQNPDSLAEAVIASSTGDLPPYLKPPPPPPPVRFCQMAASNTPAVRKSPFLKRICNSVTSLQQCNSNYSLRSKSPPNSQHKSRIPYTRSQSVTSKRSLSPSTLQGHLQPKRNPANLPSYQKDHTSCSGTVQEKTVSIVLQKENGTFGFTLRGGIATDGVSRPLLVTHVRPDGPAGREGTLKAGDRLVSLDGMDLTRSSLLDAQMAIHEVERSATLGIRFDISVMDTVRSSGSPLLVEIERVPGSPLGLTLSTSKFNNYNIFSTSQISGQSMVVVESIRTASIAQRCGALAVGDVVCAVDGLGLDHSTVKEANQILKSGQGSKVTLEIIPNKCHQNLNNRLLSPGLSSPSTFGHRYSIYNTIGPTPPLSSTTRRIQRRLREDSSLSPGRSGVSHPETVQTTLLTEGRSVGLALRPSVDSTFPLVAALDPGGAADKVGVICVGDRILAVNGRSVNGSGVSEVNQMMTNTRPTVIVDVEFDVADSVVPSSGTFSVKLSKLQSCLGIRIVKSKLSKPAELAEEAFLISDIVRGSSAHRSGTLQVGDRLLAVNSTRVDSLTLEETRCLLDQEGDFVTLKIQKDELYAEDSSNHVTYTVQLLRDGGVLGISATGSEEPFEPIYVGGIAPGSVAAQTGAIHVGDRLLAINGFSLRGKPLSEAVRLLQGPEQTVALKISRPKDTNLVTPNGLSHDWMGFHGPPTLSGDSAVESWDSGGLDQPRESSDTSHIDRSTSPDIFRSNCGSTVRRKVNSVTGGSDGDNSKEIRKSWGSGPSSDSGQSEDNTDWDKMIADLNQISATCGLNGDKALASTLVVKSESLVKNSSWSNINSASNSIDEKIKSLSEPSICAFKFGRRTVSPDLPDEGAYSVTKAAATHRATSPSSSEDTLTSLSKVFTVTLDKDPFYEDFGFSLSDGLYEKGVYVNRIRKGGPADRSGLLRPYDRILQVNDNQTDDFDCCLTVPLIASAEDTLFLKISRPSAPPISLVNELRLNAWLEAEDEDSGVASPSFIKDLT